MLLNCRTTALRYSSQQKSNPSNQTDSFATSYPQHCRRPLRLNTSHLILFANPLTLDAPTPASLSPPWLSFRKLQGICESIKRMAKVPSEDSGKPTEIFASASVHLVIETLLQQHLSFSVSTFVSSSLGRASQFLCSIPKFYVGWIPSLLRSPIAAMALVIPGLSSSAPPSLSHHLVLCQHC